MIRYTFQFARIGRRRDLKLVVDTDDVDTLSDKVLAFAMQYLGSRNVEVWIDLDAGTGYLSAWFSKLGEFTVTERSVPA